jgi:hypothetical protein
VINIEEKIPVLKVYYKDDRSNYQDVHLVYNFVTKEINHEKSSASDYLVSSNPIKGKAIPLHAWTGPEGSGKLRLPDFKTVGT